MKKIFITFVGYIKNKGEKRKKMFDAGNRLLNQAKSLNLFDECYLITDEDLKKDNDFWQKHKDFIENNYKGYGFWIWKPYIIQKYMKKINNGDVLLYLDAGCEIDIRKKNKINEIFDIVKTDYILGTEAGGCLEKHWTKRDIFIKLDCDNEKYYNSIQRQGGTNAFLKCNKTIKLIDKWVYFSSKYNLINNSPSINENYPDFQCNRHDQSIFSLLTKKYNIYSEYSLYPYFEVLRNKTGKSRLK